MDPVEILPKEMWEYIIEKVYIYEDKLSAYNTCKLWRSFLSRNRTEWMQHGIFPFLAEYLRTCDILNCRRVCSSWNKGVDSHLQRDQPIIDTLTHHQYEPHSYEPIRKFGIDFSLIAVRHSRTLLEVLACFQTIFNPSGEAAVKNPFISRSMEIILDKLDSPEVESLFENFGTHLECLRVYINHFDREEVSSLTHVAKFVWKFLGHVPNLKQLELRTCEFIEYCRRGRHVAEAHRREVEMFFRHNSAPPLPQLRNFKLTGNFKRINQVLETAYGSQRTKCVRYSCYEYLPPTLTNLTELSWNFHSLNRDDELRAFSTVQCPKLQHLRLFVKSSHMSEYENEHILTGHLFYAIERFQSSLTHLEMIWSDLKPTLSDPLNLPFVRELSVKIADCKNPKRLDLSFLQGLKSLRKLECVLCQCSYDYYVKRRTEQSLSTLETVDLHYFLNDENSAGPYKSNIWRLLPYLDIIIVQVARTPGDGLHTHWVPEGVLSKTYTRLEMNKRNEP